jgi:carbon storage regulator
MLVLTRRKNESLVIGESTYVEVIFIGTEKIQLQVSQKNNKENQKVVVDLLLGDSYQLPENVILKMLKIDGSQLKIGISAPREIPVHREEIYERIQNEKT